MTGSGAFRLGRVARRLLSSDVWTDGSSPIPSLRNSRAGRCTGIALL